MKGGQGRKRKRKQKEQEEDKGIKKERRNMHENSTSNSS